MDLHRNEEAVSAAIATVLLFGGVVSIISLMMVTMIPVIEELEEVERHDMSAQMTQFNHQTTTLSKQGMPGDVVTQEFVPVDGALSWDMDERYVVFIHMGREPFL